MKNNNKSMNLQNILVLSVFLLLFFSFSFPVNIASETNQIREKAAFSNIPNSEKRILADDSARDEKLLRLTNNDKLTGEIIEQHSLIVGSKISITCRRPVYSWLVDHINISAALSRFFGMNYKLSPGTLYEYHGVDGEGLNVDFYRAYHDSTTTVFVGDGKIKIFFITISGSFINYMEYNNTNSALMESQNCIYARIKNPVTRLFASMVFAVSDVEETIMEKIFALDDTVYKLVKTLMDDPHLYIMLKEPQSPVPEGASDIAVKIRDSVVRESSIKTAQELGELVEKARYEVRRSNIFER
ncbi:MAG: hypothetical protein HOC71_01840 [Candidatus Latescibacteria bacterium]|jgi:hypothetical protein|nr:hypothetical protein [Candidatus Latescibacterota bacterium]